MSGAWFDDRLKTREDCDRFLTESGKAPDDPMRFQARALRELMNSGRTRESILSEEVLKAARAALKDYRAARPTIACELDMDHGIPGETPPTVTVDGVKVETAKKEELARRIVKPIDLPEPKDAPIEETWQLLLSWFRKHFWIKHDRFYNILALETISTFLQDLSNTAPIVVFTGIKGSGKTNGTIALALVSYKGAFSVAPTLSPVFRAIELNPGMTLALDEFTYSEKASTEDNDVSELFRILRASVRRGANVWRTEEIDGQRWPVPYNVFGPKIMNTTKLEGIPPDLLDRALVILCVVPPMRERSGKRPIEFEDTPEARELRSRILGVVAKAKQTPPDVPDMSEFNVDLRLRDLGEALGRAAAVFGKVEELKDYLRAELNERQDRARESRYGELVSAVTHAFQNGNPESKPRKISISQIIESWKTVNEMEDGQLTPSNRMIGSMLKRLGFEKEEVRDRRSRATLMQVREDELRPICDQYGIAWEQDTPIPPSKFNQKVLTP